MIQNQQQALMEIERLDLPEIFKRIASRDIPVALAGFCEPVREYYKLLPDLLATVPECKNYLPLWESNLEFVIALDSSSGVYIRYRYGEKSDKVLGVTYQKFLSAVMLDLVDSGIWDALEELSALFGYRYAEELKSFVESCDDSDFQSSNCRFVKSIPD